MGKTGKSCLFVIAIIAICSAIVITGCSSGPSMEELKKMRDISWTGTELTVIVGTNKTNNCEWVADIEDDKVIDYSINRKFTLADSAVTKGDAAGTSSIGFEGKSEGTTTILLTTEKDWDGNEPGYSYTITVEVAPDGNIVSATGAES